MFQWTQHLNPPCFYILQNFPTLTLKQFNKFLELQWHFGELLKYLSKATTRVSILATISKLDRHRTTKLLQCATQRMPCMCGA